MDSKVCDDSKVWDISDKREVSAAVAEVVSKDSSARSNVSAILDVSAASAAADVASDFWKISEMREVSAAVAEASNASELEKVLEVSVVIDVDSAGNDRPNPHEDPPPPTPPLPAAPPLPGLPTPKTSSLKATVVVAACDGPAPGI